jgi:preprotein translocase subunit SecG
MIFSILIILVCILLILVVLVQNSKGGGIQSQFGAATQIMGVKRGTEFIEKATWGLAIALIALSVLMAPKGTVQQDNSEDAGSVAKRKAQTAVSIPAQPQPGQQPK